MVEYKTLYQNIYNKSNCYSEGQGFTLISSQSSSSGIQMLKAIKRGESLLLYVDGNTGTDKTNLANERIINVEFLGENLYARYGAAYISHLANIPLIIAATYKPNLDDIRVKFFEALYPPLGFDREIFVQNTTQRISTELSKLVKVYPGQWESWLHLQSVVKPQTFNKTIKFAKTVITKQFYDFNHKNFDLFVVESDLSV